MLLQRCQKGQIIDENDLRVFCGEYGEGVYAMKRGDKSMQTYYTKNKENTFSFEIDDKFICNLSKKKMDYWEIKAFIYNNPQYKAFILRHKGYGIPTSKQILITDKSIIINLKNTKNGNN